MKQINKTMELTILPGPKAPWQRFQEEIEEQEHSPLYRKRHQLPRDYFKRIFVTINVEDRIDIGHKLVLDHIHKTLTQAEGREDEEDVLQVKQGVFHHLAKTTQKTYQS